MRNIGLVFSCIAALAAIGMPGWCPADTAVHVAPDGDDGGAGSLESPLATLEAALAKVRTLRGSGVDGPVRIVMRGGLYGVTAPVTLTAADSGTEESPLFIEAYPEETPVLHGGARVTGWRVEEGRWVADIPAGLPEDADLSALWVNGRRATAARTPNATNPAGDFPEERDFFYAAGPVLLRDAEGKETKSNRAFVYREGDLQPWAGLDEAVVVVFHSWETSLHRVEALDTETRTVHFKKAAAWPFTHWRGDQWYFVENLLEGLDQPGEWCLSRKAGKIYYLPMPGESPETAEAWVPVAKQLLVVPEGAGPVAHVALRGLAFQYTGWGVGPEGHSDGQAAFSVPAALDLFAARNWVIEDCRVAHVGTYGVWFHQGSRDNLLNRCEITDLGAGGVRIGEGKSPAREEDATEGNTVENCFIHDAGRMYRGAVGVWIGRSSYNRVTHNEICDIRYTGVSVGWSWGYEESSANHNLIDNNHIHNIAKGQLSDTGGIYTLGVSPGTVLRGNFIHDVLSNPKVSGGWGLYTDEGSTDILLENNIVFNTQTGGFHQHYGKENRVVNNIFAFSHGDQLVRSREEDHISFFFERNIVVYNNGRLLGSTWKNGNFRMANNCYWDLSGEAPDFAGMTLEEWQAAGQDEGSIVADPQFADLEARDFSLPEDSPAMALGFEPLDPFDAGLHGAGAWTEKPGAIARPARPLPSASSASLSLDFAGLSDGARCPGAETIGESGDATIRVEAGGGRDGGNALVFTDAAGLDHRFNPHLVFMPGLLRGTALCRFTLKLEEGADFFHEWRDRRSPYRVGPSVHFRPDGSVQAGGGAVVGRWTPDTWMTVEIHCGLGNAATGTFSLSLTRNGERSEHPEIACGAADFTRLEWFGFVANSDAPVRVWLDELSLATGSGEG